MKLIINASVLIAFYTELQKPELLKCLINYGYELLIPEEVMRELEKDANYDKISKDCSEGLFKRLDPVPEKELKELKSRFIGLHGGELGVIWWGIKFRDEGISNVKCVLDDDKARKKARKLGLQSREPLFELGGDFVPGTLFLLYFLFLCIRILGLLFLIRAKSLSKYPLSFIFLMISSTILSLTP